jgi:hypothetical protein
LDSIDRAGELERLLDELSYQVTAARTAGMARPDAVRAALKRIGKLVADIDSLAVTELAEQRKQ